jgi:predicted PurR-regulated permease PerM
MSRVAGIIGAGAVLAILYFGRDVLMPITLAGLLGFLLAPLIYRLRRIGFGHSASIWAAVFAAAAAVVGTAAVIATQFLQMEAALPRYEETVRIKLAAIDALTSDWLQVLAEPIAHLTHPADGGAGAKAPNAREHGAAADDAAPLPVEVRTPRAGRLQVLAQLLSSVWTPIASIGLVFVVLVFVLLERESLRDRFIRLAGETDLRVTTLAINDAATRLSRFFVSQFTVNMAVGLTVWIGLTLLGLSHALLWGMLTALLRFVPYIGVWIAALCATAFAAGVDPGWSLPLETLGWYVMIEVVVSQLVEPQLYGHTTGLSPLSVVIAAIFWSWIWGPVGLVVSTPLTLCLVVAGHYVRALHFLEVLFGDAPALSLAQNFYQRALAADAGEIIVAARRFLRGKSLAAYCDVVLTPAFLLAWRDVQDGTISPAEQAKVGSAVAAVLQSLSSPGKWWAPVPKVSLLSDVSLGRQLRRQREQVSGRWQGPLDVPPGSIVLCVGLGSTGHDLAAEVLVRVLRTQDIDARHVSAEELAAPPPPGSSPDSLASAIIVSIDPARESEQIAATARTLRGRSTPMRILALLIQGPYALPLPPQMNIAGVDRVVLSFEEAVEQSQTRPRR